jgi:hypothetical protein
MFEVFAMFAVNMIEVEIASPSMPRRFWGKLL